MTFLTIHPPPHVTLTTNHLLSVCCLLSTNSHPRYACPLGVGVTEKEQTEGSNDILNYPPTTPRNPNHESTAFRVLLTVN